MVATDPQRGRDNQSLSGELDAFETLIREHQRMIQSLCYRMTGSIADAEDLAQEAFIRAYEHRGEFRGDARVSSWLYRIAVNQCLNWKKRAARREQAHREWSREQGFAGGPAQVDAGLGQQVHQALLKLDDKQRAAVILTVYDGLNHAEAAQILGCSETTVSWRLFMARRKLKSLLKSVQTHPAP
jgi:RNA polymerase sigma-70 factor (ECF subfamily)